MSVFCKICNKIQQVLCRKVEPQPEIINILYGDDISKIVSGLNYRFYQKIDKTYTEVSLKSIKEFLQFDMISKNDYILDIYDCDNFAIDLLHRMWHWAPNMPFGLCFVNGHVLNCFVSEGQFYFIEPQNDHIMTSLPDKYHINFLVI
jgi:hypothetical protein